MRLLDKNYLADAIIRNRLLSIFGSLVLTALLGLGLQHLTFDPDFDTFFPELEFKTLSLVFIEPE